MMPPPASLQGSNGALTMKSAVSSAGFAPSTLTMQSGAESMISGMPLLLPRLRGKGRFEPLHGLGFLAEAALLADHPSAEHADGRHEDGRADHERQHGLPHPLTFGRRPRWS